VGLADDGNLVRACENTCVVSGVNVEVVGGAAFLRGVIDEGKGPAVGH